MSWEQRGDVSDHLHNCLDVPRWVDAVLAGRPYVTDAQARIAVMTAAAPLTPSEIHGALRHHPRIGERPRGAGVHANAARIEQSGVDTSESGVGDRLRAGNEDYERRFGHVFLIRAAGRNASEVLSELTRRSVNDAETELAVVEYELREIAALRLLGPVPA